MKYLSHRLSAAMWTRVVILWLMLGVVSLVAGGGALAMGQFVQDNIRTELSSQQITFNTVDKMSDEEKALPGMVENAGQPLSNGNQAKVYASLIGLHISESAKDAGFEGASYASLGAVQREKRAAVAAATEAGDEDALKTANDELTAVTNLRNTFLTANTLRGNLLSAFGWDNFATGIVMAGIIILVLAVVFFGLFIYELRLGHLPPTDAK